MGQYPQQHGSRNPSGHDECADPHIFNAANTYIYHPELGDMCGCGSVELPSTPPTVPFPCHSMADVSTDRLQWRSTGHL